MRPEEEPKFVRGTKQEIARQLKDLELQRKAALEKLKRK